LGYGFVEMESEEAAKNAVQVMNKQSINDRPINVEIARPLEENGEAKRVRIL
jgi:RNA recognition motif-containing protein